jgi:hypothetical protein
MTNWAFPYYRPPSTWEMPQPHPPPFLDHSQVNPDLNQFLITNTPTPHTWDPHLPFFTGGPELVARTSRGHVPAEEAHNGPATVLWLESGHTPHGIPGRERVKNQLERRAPSTHTTQDDEKHHHHHASTHSLLVWPHLIGNREGWAPSTDLLGPGLLSLSSRNVWGNHTHMDPKAVMHGHCGWGPGYI